MFTNFNNSLVATFIHFFFSVKKNPGHLALNMGSVALSSAPMVRFEDIGSTELLGTYYVGFESMGLTPLLSLPN